MIGYLKGLLSSGEIIKGGMSALDKLVLTDEEKLDFKLKFAAATMPMNRARRAITIAVSTIWAVHMPIGTALLLSGNEKFGEFMQYTTTNISVPFGLVLAFYFYTGKSKK